LENRIVEHLFTGIRQLVAVAMILFGAVLAGNSVWGLLAEEPFPAIFVCIPGLELIFCSYFVVRKLKAEANFRVIIYFFLVMWSRTLLAPVFDLVRFRVPDATGIWRPLLFGIARRCRNFEPRPLLQVLWRKKHDYPCVVNHAGRVSAAGEILGAVSDKLWRLKPVS
jgi:hypothetical protein